MTRFKAPTPPYVGPVAHYSAGNNKPIDRLVIHSTVSATVPGGARAIGRYFAAETAGGSAHYITDPAETVQAAYDSVICWHAPPNPRSLGIEMCDIPGPLPGDKPGTALFRAAKARWRWNDEPHQLLLDRTARLTAELALAYGVPLRFVGPLGLRRGRRGITTHASVSLAWRQSSHWDPGFWPRRQFMRLVRKHAKELQS